MRSLVVGVGILNGYININTLCGSDECKMPILSLKCPSVHWSHHKKHSDFISGQVLNSIYTKMGNSYSDRQEKIWSYEFIFYFMKHIIEKWQFGIGKCILIPWTNFPSGRQFKSMFFHVSIFVHLFSDRKFIEYILRKWIFSAAGGWFCLLVNQFSNSIFLANDCDAQNRMCHSFSGHRQPERILFAPKKYENPNSKIKL